MVCEEKGGPSKIVSGGGKKGTIGRAIVSRAGGEKKKPCKSKPIEFYKFNQSAHHTRSLKIVQAPEHDMDRTWNARGVFLWRGAGGEAHDRELKDRCGMP